MAKDERMDAVVVNEPGGPESLFLRTIEKPVAGKDDLLVRVVATALNRADLMQREGRYPPPEGASPILGLELAGTVVAKGASCPTWNVGDSVFGLLSGGGYAEYALIDRDLAMPIPEGMSFDEAAAIPEVFLTAFQALYRYGEMRAGKRVLIHAGASGVGTAALQLVVAAGGTAFVTSSASKHDACLALGASHAIDYRSEDFAERIRDVTGGDGVDVVIDFIGAQYFARNVDVLAVDGRLIILSMLGGSQIEAFDLRRLFRRRAGVYTSSLRNRSLAYKRSLTKEFAAYALPLFAEGALRPVIDRSYDWADVRDAHRYMEANRNIGKIVLRVKP